MRKSKKVVCVSGYWNPVHRGHIRLLKEAKKFGDKLVVIVNNDEQVKLKGSFPFMSAEERIEIVAELKPVDDVVLSIDKDKTVCKTLRKVHPDFFVNGGDRKSKKDIPEAGVCNELGIKMLFGVGGKSKIQSSSWLIKKVIDNYKKLCHSKKDIHLGIKENIIQKK